jgi:SAM-dependent methyltransferase
MDMETSAKQAEGDGAFAYWPGNVAKHRIVETIARRSEPIRVLDYGAGNGGHWPELLRRWPHISLTAFEPHEPSCVQLRERFRGLPNARVVSQVEQADQLDAVVSFSVLEHVLDRPAYVETAFRWLRPGGTFYLSYDDGHFRRKFDLSSRDFEPIREHLRNLGAPLWPKIGKIGWYQSRVRKSDADRIIADAGFEVVGERYENIESMKRLACAMPVQDRAAFMDFWMNMETELNARFAISGNERWGDANMLWREMGTRTLELRRPAG